MDKQPLYFLEVVKEGEQPSWSLEDPELVSASQPLDDGYVQFWAHPKESVFKPGAQPPCEALTRQYPADRPALLVNQLSNGPVLLELLIVSQNHVWVRTESNLENLDDNVSAVLSFAQKKFNITVEGFMTTDSVTEEVEAKMDRIEDKGDSGEQELDEKSNDEAEEEVEAEPEESAEEIGVREPENVPLKDERPTPPAAPMPSPVATPRITVDDVPPAHTLDALIEEDEAPAHVPPLRSAGSGYTNYTPPVYTTGNRTGSGNSSSKAWLLLPLAVLALAVGGAFIFKDQLIAGASHLPFLAAAPSPSPSATPTPSVTPSPTPTVPSIDRSKYTVRVLNGTTKSGAAGTLADKLKELGWKIERTGNATNSATAQTLIRTKKGEEAVGEVLTHDIAPDLSAASSTALPTTDRSEAEVVIGLQ